MAIDVINTVRVMLDHQAMTHILSVLIATHSSIRIKQDQAFTHIMSVEVTLDAGEVNVFDMVMHAE